MDTALVTYIPEAQTALPILSGCVVFGTTLAVSTLAQKIIGISTATKVVPSVVGVVTVCVASMASQRAAMINWEWVRQRQQRLLFSTTFPSIKNPFAIQNKSTKNYWNIGTLSIPLPLSLEDLRV